MGIASARALLWAFAGCAPKSRAVARPVSEVSGEVRLWLHDAVAKLHGAGFTRAHALAVRRTRATAAVDVLGSGVSRERADAVVLAVEDAHGMREQVTSELTESGIAAAVRRLAPKASARAPIEFGPAPVRVGELELDAISDASLLDRVAAIEHRELSSRIVYA